jgi:protein TonB
MAIPGFKPVFVTGAVENLVTEETATAEPAVAAPAPSVQQTVIAAGDLVLVERVQPKYPDLAVREGIESGSVTVKFMVQPDGSVSNPVVTDAKPRRDVFDQAALRAIMHWKFKPIAAARESSITLDFKLAGGG